MHRSHSLRVLVRLVIAVVALLESPLSHASDEAPAAYESPPEAAPAEAPATAPSEPRTATEPPPAVAPPSEPPTGDAASAPSAPPNAAFPADAPSPQVATPLQREPAVVANPAAPPSAVALGAPQRDERVPPARSVDPLSPDPEPERRHPSDGLFGPVRIGFLVGVGLPNLLNFGGTAKITRFLGGGINVGIIPAARLSYYGEATLSYQEYDIYGRIYPFGGGFFLGAGAGYSKVRGTLRGKVDLAKYASGQLPIPPGLLPPGYQLPTSIDYEARGSVRTMVLTPQIGYLYTARSGFSIGIDVGAQIPIAPSDIVFESSVSPPEVAELAPFKEQQKKVRDTLETVGRTPLPSLNFRIGWLL